MTLKPGALRLKEPGAGAAGGPGSDVYASLLADEGILLLQRTEGSRFRVVGDPPDWVETVAPGTFKPDAETDVSQVFLFLDYFLEDAEVAWHSPAAEPLTSDVWTQDAGSGREFPFTATARLIDHQEFLLIRALGVNFEERRRVLQKARELVLTHEKFIKEISKKEALLHCLVHDVAGPATALSNCLGLLSMEPGLSEDGRDLVKLGVSEVKRQEVLLRGTLDIFASELTDLEEYSTVAATAPDVRRCIRSVQKQLEAGFIAKGISLEVVSERDRREVVKVVGSFEKLERILYNLLENAIRHGPMGSSVAVRIVDEGAAIRIAVEDEGPGVEPGMEDKIFGRFRQGHGDAGKAGLGLFFCQMMVKRWGGEIGCKSLESGGAQFWFKLPKPQGE